MAVTHLLSLGALFLTMVPARNITTMTATTTSTTASLRACTSPVDDHGAYTLTSSPNDTATWTLQCSPGYAPADVTKGILRRCDRNGEFLQPVATPCHASLGCSKSQLQALVGRDFESTCFQDSDSIVEGSSCRATCPSEYVSVGSFSCSFGEILGESHCMSVEQRDGLQVSDVIGVASTFKMTLAGCTADSNFMSCSSRLKSALQDTLESLVLQVNVKSSTVDYISSTSAVSAGLRGASVQARPSGNQVYGVFNVSFTVAVLPESSQMLDVEITRILQRITALGAMETDAYDVLVQSLASTHVPISLSSVVVQVAPRPFKTVMPMSRSTSINLPQARMPSAPSRRISAEGKIGIATDVLLYSGSVIVLSCLVSGVVFGLCYSLHGVEVLIEKGDKGNVAIKEELQKVVEEPFRLGTDLIDARKKDVGKLRTTEADLDMEYEKRLDCLGPTEVDLDAEYERRMAAKMKYDREGEVGKEDHTTGSMGSNGSTERKSQWDLCRITPHLPREPELEERRKTRRLSAKV